KNLAEPLTLPGLAQKLGWSPSHFKTRFREEIGIPPAQFYLRRRITESCRRLEGTGHSVTRIALDLGFESAEYFATAFKRVTGLTPREFREQASSSRSRCAVASGESPGRGHQSRPLRRN